MKYFLSPDCLALFIRLNVSVCTSFPVHCTNWAVKCIQNFRKRGQPNFSPELTFSFPELVYLIFVICNVIVMWSKISKPSFVFFIMKLVYDVVLLALIYDFSELQVEWFPLRNLPKNVQQFVPFPKIPGDFGRKESYFRSLIIVTSSRRCCWWRYWQWTTANPLLSPIPPWAHKF